MFNGKRINELEYKLERLTNKLFGVDIRPYPLILPNKVDHISGELEILIKAIENHKKQIEKLKDIVAEIADTVYSDKGKSK